jgi:class 3 adenylate cyclase/tetratricopeptide (TPR) repeat protein
VKCPRCQSENREEARFCIRCGEKLEQSCPHCGNNMLWSARFCDECGYALLSPDLPSPVDYSLPRSYTPKPLVERILSNRNYIEGERKRVTALFADVANYTSISEKLDPEEMHKIMEGCFKVLMDEVHRYEGIITHFSGDGMMAIFGAPLAHEDHAQRACYAGLSLQKAIRTYGDGIQKRYGTAFIMRVGIHAGLVIVGSIGDDLRMDYTAIGDTINLASRLQQMAPPGSILTSYETYRMARDFFNFKPIGKLTLKGKEEPVEAFELLQASEVETRFGAAVARGLTRFVGRESELQSLKTIFEKVRSGAGQLVGIVGEAGVGKSRLVLEFRNALREVPHTCLEGECLHHGSTVAYLPIRDVLRSYFDLQEGMSEPLIKRKMEGKILGLDGKLSHILPPFYELLSLTLREDPILKLDPKQKKEQTFEALRDWLIRESQDKPLVLVLEDLHWIDKTSEEFLTYLIGRLANARILVILLFRPEYTHPWANRSYYNRIGLDRLPPAAGSELIRSLLRGETSRDLEDLILGKAEGNPLFLEELTNTLLERGYVKKEDHRYSLSQRISEIQIPDTIQGIMAARMDRLETDLKRVIRMASVIGRTFPFPILETITGMKDGLKPCLLKLQELEFIYERSLFPELEYEFKHALVQEVAYNGLLLTRRREIHKKVAQAIESLYSDRLEEFYEMLSYHYSRSEETTQAYRYLKLSGTKAIRNSALWEAFGFYRDALEILNKSPATEETRKEKIDVSLLMGSPMISLGFPEDSLRVLQQGEELSQELNATKSLTTFCSIIGLYYSVKGDPHAGMQYGERCFRIAEEANDIELTAPIAFDLCSSYTVRGEFARVAEIAPRILALLEEQGKEFESFERGYNIYSALMAYNAFSLGYMGHFDRALDLCQKARRVALKLNNLYSLGLVEVLHGYVLCTRGDGKEALAHFEKAIQYLEKGQIFVILGLAWSGIGWANYFMGNPQAAPAYMEKGLQLHREAKISYDLSVHYWFLGAVHCDLNEVERARTEVEEAIRLAQKNDERYVEAIALMILGRIFLKMGPPHSANAEGSILKGIEIIEQLQVKTYVAVGHLCLAEGYAFAQQFEKAVHHLKVAEGMFQEMKMVYWIERVRGAVKLMQGELTRA